MSPDKDNDPSAAFGELGRLLGSKPPMQASLLRITELVKQTLTAVKDASITVLEAERGPFTLVSSGRLAVDLDARQYDADHGPCLEAARTGRTVTVHDGDPLTPYRAFSRAARATGVMHTTSIGLPLARQMMASLNIYASAPLSEADTERAAAFAGYAAATMDNATSADLDEQPATVSWRT